MVEQSTLSSPLRMTARRSGPTFYRRNGRKSRPFSSRLKNGQHAPPLELRLLVIQQLFLVAHDFVSDRVFAPEADQLTAFGVDRDAP
jgi:hypothetical protein